MKKYWPAIKWWEIRRIPFNLIILVAVILADIISLAGMGTDGEPLGLIIFNVLFLIGANIFYTLGWISEILWSGGDISRTQALRSQVWRWGTFFSAGVIIFLALLSAFLMFVFPPVGQ